MVEFNQKSGGTIRKKTHMWEHSWNVGKTTYKLRGYQARVKGESSLVWTHIEVSVDGVQKGRSGTTSDRHRCFGRLAA